MTPPKTVDPEIEPEYVGSHSCVVSNQCQEYNDVKPEEPGFNPTQCPNDATHTVVYKHRTGLAEQAVCDDCGKPEDVGEGNREWSA